MPNKGFDLREVSVGEVLAAPLAIGDVFFASQTV